MRAALALLLALGAGAAMAQEPPRGDLRYTPDPAWFDAPGYVLPGRGEGRVRVVSAPQGHAALTLDQYATYERLYARALARLAFRMPVARAMPQARAEALAAILARETEVVVPAIVLDEIAGPDLPTRPTR